MDTMPKLESKLTSDQIIEESVDESNTSHCPEQYPLGSTETDKSKAKE